MMENIDPQIVDYAFKGILLYLVRRFIKDFEGMEVQIEALKEAIKDLNGQIIKLIEENKFQAEKITIHEKRIARLESSNFEK